MVDAQSFNDRDPIDPGCRIYYVFQTADRQALSEALGITASTRMMSYEMTRRYKTHQGFLENNTDVFVQNDGLPIIKGVTYGEDGRVAVDISDEESDGDTNIERYNYIANPWGTQTFMVDDPYPHGEVTAIYSGAVNPHLINISVSVGEPAPEVTTPSEELTAVVQMSMPIKDIIIDDTCINVEFYDFVQNGLDYSYLTLASGKVVDGPLTTAQQKQQSSNENKENTEGTLYIIDRLYEQGLLQPVTETPLHTIMRQIKNQP